MNRLRNQEEGFTLVELLVVVIIIGVLAAIAVPIYLNQQNAAYDATVTSDVRNIAMTMEAKKTEVGFYSRSITVGIGNKDIYTQVNNNLLLCYDYAADDTGKFAIFAKSPSGRVFTYSSLRPSVVEYAGPWGSAAPTCQTAGVTPNVGTGRNLWGYSSKTFDTWIL